jgi:hypothetical protein
MTFVRPFTLPIFLVGIGSALDVFPASVVHTVQRPFAGYSDAQLLASDWYRVGQAFYGAMSELTAGVPHVQEEEASSSKK